ncbi:MAG: hypothetical protein AB1442_04605 [Nitrospirota bacterium]
MSSRILYLTVFGIAMGFLEAAVVVYLRDLYFPEGFAFPLKSMSLESLRVEYLRETATIVMLLSLGAVAGRNFFERLSIFLYSFGIWDIFYYVWLKALIDWPPSLLTWDILFLIPVIWVGPVLAPVICSGTMIGIALSVLHFQNRSFAMRISRRELILCLLGGLSVFITFIGDFSLMIMEGGFLNRLLQLHADPGFQNLVSNYVPVHYNWPLFALGEVLVLLALLSFWKRTMSDILIDES